MVVPGSLEQVQLFPTGFLYQGQWVDLKLTEVEQFTALLDLEKGMVRVFGRAASGAFAYGLVFQEGKLKWVTPKGIETGVLPLGVPPVPQLFTRLACGVSKALEWEKVVERELLAEYLPLLFRLSLLVPAPKHQEIVPTLLSSLKETPTDEVFWRQLIRTAFQAVLVPQPIDTGRWGYPLPIIEQGQSPWVIMQGVKEAVHTMLVREEGNRCALLPQLPHALHSGRCLDLPTTFGRCSLEWRSRRLRRAELCADRESVIHLILPKPLCRLRVEEENRRRWMRVEEPLHVQPYKPVFLDRFES